MTFSREEEHRALLDEIKWRQKAYAIMWEPGAIPMDFLRSLNILQEVAADYGSCEKATG